MRTTRNNQLGWMVSAMVMLLMVWSPGRTWATIVSVSTAAVADNELNSFFATSNKGTVAAIVAGNGSGNAAVVVGRPVFQFDLSSIPTNAHVLSATLRLAFTGNNPATITTLSLYRLTNSWTELGSTWNTKDGVNAWSTPGTGSGDHLTTPSSSVTSAFQGSTSSRVDFSFTGLATDAQYWVANPLLNDGWILINSDEVNNRTTTYPDKQMFTREWTIANSFGFDAQPFLDIQYEVVPEPGTITLLGIGFACVLARRRLTATK